MRIEIDEIKQLLPHRDPFLFLDWCEIIDIGKEGKAGSKGETGKAGRQIYIGQYNPNTKYSTGDIIQYDGKLQTIYRQNRNSQDYPRRSSKVPTRS